LGEDLWDARFAFSFNPKTFTDFTQAAVIGDWLIQIIADEPAMSQIEIHSLHQLSFRADPFEESDELELEQNGLYRY
jgi:hypothetical protein